MSRIMSNNVASEQIPFPTYNFKNNGKLPSHAHILYGNTGSYENLASLKSRETLHKKETKCQSDLD